MKKISFFKRFQQGYKAIAFIIGVLFWDMLTKIITDGVSVKIWPNVFNFVSVHNTGGAWSILNQHTWILIVLSILFLIGIFVFNYFFKQRTLFYTISFSLIVGGALGNLIDRIFLGHVRDFISLDFIPNFTIFNIADICLCVGVFMICVFFVFLLPKLEKGKLKDKKKYKMSNVKNVKKASV